MMAAIVARYLTTKIRFIESFFNTVSRYDNSGASKLAFNLTANFPFHVPGEGNVRVVA
jgi:hypothetical protein